MAQFIPSDILVAAIDFGTTYSGYAFSFRHDFHRDPLSIATNTWTSGSSRLLSLKTSSCILFDSDEKFHSLGFDAEDKYADLAFSDDHKQWFFFRHFKMQLYENQHVKRDMIIEDENGNSMPAMKVFSTLIHYMKDNLLNTCNRRIASPELRASDVRWVLTVPAIWSDGAKQFMREAAIEAGIPGRNLFLALEPECASLYCKYLSVERQGEVLQPFSAGSKYLVVDLGGGTIDMTAHEVNEDLSLRELHVATGGDWGGLKVDNAFKRLLVSIVGNKAFRLFCSEKAIDWLEMIRDFEVKKRAIGLKKDEHLVISLPPSLNDISQQENNGQSVTSILNSRHKFKDKVVCVHGRLKISADIVKDLFMETIDNIVATVERLLKTPSLYDVSSILLVGGFSDSRLVSDIMRNCLPRLKVIVPDEAGLAVLKGAVIFGHDSRIVRTRFCKLTYGVASSDVFRPGFDPECKKYYTDYGEMRCKDIFSIHVHKGQEIRVGEPQVTQQYVFVDPNKTTMTFTVFSSTDEWPQFVTDHGCHELGKLVVQSPDISRGLNRAIHLQLTFSGTEIEVSASDPFSGTNVSTSFDMLH